MVVALAFFGRADVLYAQFRQGAVLNEDRTSPPALRRSQESAKSTNRDYVHFAWVRQSALVSVACFLRTRVRFTFRLRTPAAPQLNCENRDKATC